MNEIDMKMYATGMIREYCQTLSDGICQIASACEMGPSDSADQGFADYMRTAKKYLKASAKKIRAFGDEEWASLAGLAPGIELLDYLQQDLFEVIDNLVVERLRSFRGEATRKSVEDEVLSAVGAMKAMKGLIMETSFDWYRDCFIDLVDASNAVWRQRGRKPD